MPFLPPNHQRQSTNNNIIIQRDVGLQLLLEVRELIAHLVYDRLKEVTMPRPARLVNRFHRTPTTAGRTQDHSTASLGWLQ